MLHNANSLKGCQIRASDGELGELEDFCFDDRTWEIRYAVVRTGSWLNSRKVLISATLLKREPDWRARVLPVALTREQVRNSPDIDTDRTVTRLHEIELHTHYAWPTYWGEGFYAGGMSGGTPFPPAKDDDGTGQKATAPHRQPETHLQSTGGVTGYSLHAADGVIGHVEDYIIDDRAWVIRYLVAGTGTWLPGRKVLVSPHWIEKVDWGTSEVFLDLTRLAVQGSPEYDPSQPVCEDYESDLYDHYGRPKFESAAAQRGGKR